MTDPYGLVVVHLICERCGQHYESERPRFWTEREGADHVFTGTCPTCQPLLEAEERAFAERTALRQETPESTVPDLEMPNVSPDVETELGGGHGDAFESPDTEDVDRYWE